MKILLALPLACLAVTWAQSQFDNKHLPRFEDFPITDKWNQTPVPVKLTTGSERMFRTQLANAAKEPPNFAGHYRMTYWGCGSNCSAGALIDLETGRVLTPPLSKSNGSGWERWMMCPARFNDKDDEFHLDSRLMVVKCGLHYSERLRKNIPDKYYFLLEPDGFRRLLFIAGKTLAR